MMTPPDTVRVRPANHEYDDPCFLQSCNPRPLRPSSVQTYDFMGESISDDCGTKVV